MSAAQLMTDLTRLGILVEARGNRLRYSPQSAVTGSLLEQLKLHKADLLAMLRPSGGFEEQPQDDKPVAGLVPVAGSVIEWADCVEPPEPCPSCGGITVWWDPLGGQHCMTCEPPTASRKLRRDAERICRRYETAKTTPSAKRLANEK